MRCYKLPKDIELIIKEYSMPIYRRCSHYKAYINTPNNSIYLKMTPYKLGYVKLSGCSIFDDLCRNDYI